MLMMYFTSQMTRNCIAFRAFRQSFEKQFDIKSSDTVDVYLGNAVIINKSQRKVALSQSH